MLLESARNAFLRIAHAPSGKGTVGMMKSHPFHLCHRPTDQGRIFVPVFAQLFLLLSPLAERRLQALGGSLCEQ